MAFPLGDIGEVYELDAAAAGEGVGGLRRIRLTWVSGSNGVAARVLRHELHGTLHRIVAWNSDSGLTSYDLELYDADGADVLDGLGAAIAGGTSVERPLYDLPATDQVRPIFVMGAHQLAITADTSGRSGIVDLYLLPALRRDFA